MQRNKSKVREHDEQGRQITRKSKMSKSCLHKKVERDPFHDHLGNEHNATYIINDIQSGTERTSDNEVRKRSHSIDHDHNINRENEVIVLDNHSEKLWNRARRKFQRVLINRIFHIVSDLLIIIERNKINSITRNKN